MREVDAFVEEVAVMREAVLELHAKWFEGERAQLMRERLKEGMSDREMRRVHERIERSLWAIWLQDEENKLINMIALELKRLGWRVDALVFDGVMVRSADRSLQTTLRTVEQRLEKCDWIVKLAEKPLYGQQHGPITTIEVAKQIVSRSE